MLWKIYFWVFTMVAVWSALTGFGEPKNIVLAIIDLLLNAGAIAALFLYTYRKQVGSQRLWKIFAAVFIVYDIAYGLFIDPAGSVPAALFGLMSMAPAYAGVYMYSRGALNIPRWVRDNAQKEPAPEDERGRSPIRTWIESYKLIWLHDKAVLTLVIVAQTLSSLSLVAVSWTDTLNFIQANPVVVLAIVVAYCLSALFLNLVYVIAALNTVGERTHKVGGVLSLGLKKLPAYLALMLISFVLIMAGMFFFIVPGIFIALRIMLAPFVMIDQKVGPVTAMKISNRLMGGNAVEFFGAFSLYVFTTIATFFVFLIPYAGAYLLTIIMMASALALNVYFATVYQDLKKSFDNNRLRPKPSKANIWLLVAAVAAYLALIGGLSYYFYSMGQNTSDHSTACYTVTLPDAFTVRSAGECHLFANSALLNLEYKPVNSSARSAAVLANDYGAKLFPTGQYKVFSKSAETYALDGSSSIDYVYEANHKSGYAAEVLFVNSMTARKVSGVETHNFILIGKPNANGYLNAMNPLSVLGGGAVYLPNTIKVNGAGGADYNADMEKVYEAAADQDYSGMVAAADAAYSWAETDSQQSLALSAKGAADYYLDKKTDAETDIRKAVDLDPRNLLAWVYLGSILVDKQDYDGVMNCADKIVGVDPYFADAYNLYGLVYQWRDDKKQAAKNFQKAAVLDPKNETYQNNARYFSK